MTETNSAISDQERSSGPIVVGVDGSEASRLALEWAAREAEAHGKVVLAISAYSMPALAAAAPGYTMEAANIQELADYSAGVLKAEIARVAATHPKVRIEAKVVEGPAARTLVEASLKASMLVVGSRGHGGFVGLLLGSVSHQCVAHADCPVLVVRPGRGSPAASADPTSAGASGAGLAPIG